MAKHTLRNTIVGTVVGSLVATAALALWPTARSAMAAAWDWLWSSSSYSVQGWLLVVLVILVLVVLVQLVLAIVASRAPPHQKEYTQDVMHGVRWRWEWHHGSPAGVWCFCPACDGELVYQEFRQSRGLHVGPGETSEPDHTLLICKRCYAEKAKVQGLEHHLVQDVSREIERRARTGEWQRER